MEVFLGRTGEARAHFEAALAMAREAGDRQREGSILGNLGIQYINAEAWTRPGRMTKRRLPWHGR